MARCVCEHCGAAFERSAERVPASSRHFCSRACSAAGHRRPPMERLLAKAERLESGCIEWRGSRLWNGYGKFKVDGRMVLVHRFAYEQARGPVPAGLELDHLCRNRACLNVDHLEPVSRRENALRGEAPSAVNARKTHCVHGHAFDDANTRVIRRADGSGFRVCRACVRAAVARYKARKETRL